MVTGSIQHLGCFATAKEAAVAYDETIVKTKQSPSMLNFPQKDAREKKEEKKKGDG
jgi:hypothetical protein